MNVSVSEGAGSVGIDITASGATFVEVFLESGTATGHTYNLTYALPAHAWCLMYVCMYVYVAVPRQDSMSPVWANAVLSGHCICWI